MKKKRIIVLFVVAVITLGIYLSWRTYNKSLKEWHNLPKTPQTKEEVVKKELLEDYYPKAEKIVEEMTLNEKIGQLFLVRYNISEIEGYKDYYPGGYILFAKDFENHTKASIKEELEYVQSINKYPLLLGVDEEGGVVTRVSRFRAFRETFFYAPKYYYEQGGYELLEEIEKEKAELLKSIGLNWNLAPVADISINPADFIYDRSFGKDANETSEFIKKMVTYAKENKINATLKHFPGYGNNIDTHTGVAIDNRSYETFLEEDFKPFEAGIKAGVPSVLISHNVVTSIDPEYPSSLSNKVIKELRENLDFSGIIMTDDLAMDAVKSYVEGGHAATLAINAGNDMIITSDFITMYNEIYQAVEMEEIKEETINKAVIRILAWKYSSGLFENSDIIA